MKEFIQKNKAILIVTIMLCIFFLLNQKTYANNGLNVEIKSVQKTLQRYKPVQKASLHLDLAELYIKNNRWWLFYKHIRTLYDECKDLQKIKILFKSELEYPEEEIIVEKIDPNIVKYLQEIGIYNVKTKNDALSFIKALKPVCEAKCDPYIDSLKD